MDEKLICPYCGKEQEWVEDEISADTCYYECEKCGKGFWYSVEITYDYCSWKDKE